MIRIAVIGGGVIGPRHCEAVQVSSDTDLVAIVEPSPGGPALAKRLNVNLYVSIELLLSSADKPDAAIIATPNHTHTKVAEELINGGVHVLIEKPVCTDLNDGISLGKLAKEKGVKAIVGHHRRFNPYIIAGKIALEQIGQITAVNGLWTLQKPREYFEPPMEWHGQSGGGIIYINMIHDIDLMHYLLGPIKRVYAEKSINRRGLGVEEGAAVTLRFASGVVGTFFASDNVASPFNFESGTGENPVIPKVGLDFYRIFGTNGTLSLPEVTVYKYEHGAGWTDNIIPHKFEINHERPFDLQLCHFVKVIKGQEEPSCSIESGVAALQVARAIEDSILSNAPVDLEYKLF